MNSFKRLLELKKEIECKNIDLESVREKIKNNTSDLNSNLSYILDLNAHISNLSQDRNLLENETSRYNVFFLVLMISLMVLFTFFSDMVANIGFLKFLVFLNIITFIGSEVIYIIKKNKLEKIRDDNVSDVVFEESKRDLLFERREILEQRMQKLKLQEKGIIQEITSLEDEYNILYNKVIAEVGPFLDELIAKEILDNNIVKRIREI